MRLVSASPIAVIDTPDPDPLRSDTAVAQGTPRGPINITTDPLVSVIIPCYNGAAFLEETIKSVLAQTYPHVEIVVVDDGSTDNSAEIAQRFPVRYIWQENRGLPGTRNSGIRESEGSYLVFLDADDLLKPEAIETGLRFLETRPECAMAVGDHIFISADGAFLANSRKVFVNQSSYEALLKSNFIEMISSVIFRRSIFEEFGGFDPTLRVAEDYELYLRIARAHPICCHDAVVAEYRIHGTNLSRNSELMLATTLRVLRSQAQFIRNDVERRRAFRKGLRSWRKQYGRQLASELAGPLSTLSADNLRRKLLLLAGQYPQGLFLLVLLRILPGPSKRKGLSVVPQPRVGDESLFLQSNPRQVLPLRIAGHERLVLQMGASNPVQPAQMGHGSS